MIDGCWWKVPPPAEKPKKDLGSLTGQPWAQWNEWMLDVSRKKKAEEIGFQVFYCWIMLTSFLIDTFDKRRHTALIKWLQHKRIKGPLQLDDESPFRRCHKVIKWWCMSSIQNTKTHAWIRAQLKSKTITSGCKPRLSMWPHHATKANLRVPVLWTFDRNSYNGKAGIPFSDIGVTTA